MATLTIADLDNGKRDLQTVDAVANSPEDTAITRYGGSVPTLAGVLRRLGYAAPVPYAVGMAVDSGLTTVERDGVVYRPDPALVPFTTGAWDADQWRVVQNTNGSNQVYQFATPAEAQSAAATLPEGSAVIVEGVSQGHVEAGQYVPDSGVPIPTVPDYASLSAYTGEHRLIRVSDSFRAGIFARTNPDTSQDDGGVNIAGGWTRTGDVSKPRASWFGVVGDGAADDWEAFKKACIYAKTSGVELDIRGLKINLLSQSEPIDSDGFRLIGSGTPEPQVNWDWQQGDSTQKTVVVASVLNTSGTVIISSFNGPVFSGKTLNGSDFSILCDPTKNSSRGYSTGVAASYPGSSQSLKNAKNISVFYAGNDGFECLAGLEVLEIDGLRASYCMGYGLDVGQTAGEESPIEYLKILGNCAFSSNLLGNVRFDGARKDLTILGNYNDPGQTSRRSQTEGYFPTSIADLVPAVHIIKDAGVISLNSVTVSGFAEDCNLFARLDGSYGNAISVENVYQMAFRPAELPHFVARLEMPIASLKISRNFNPAGVAYYSSAAVAREHTHVEFDEFALIGANFTTTGLRDGQRKRKETWGIVSPSIGSGDAGTFTFDLGAVLQLPAPDTDTGTRWSAFSLTANFQGTGSSGVGAYIMLVSRVSNGQYVGLLVNSTSSSGFTAPPVMGPGGIISMHLKQYYRGRVVQIDYSPRS